MKCFASAFDPSREMASSRLDHYSPWFKLEGIHCRPDILKHPLREVQADVGGE